MLLGAIQGVPLVPGPHSPFRAPSCCPEPEASCQGTRGRMPPCSTAGPNRASDPCLGLRTSSVGARTGGPPSPSLRRFSSTAGARTKRVLAPAAACFCTPHLSLDHSPSRHHLPGHPLPPLSMQTHHATRHAKVAFRPSPDRVDSPPPAAALHPSSFQQRLCTPVHTPQRLAGACTPGPPPPPHACICTLQLRSAPVPLHARRLHCVGSSVRGLPAARLAPRNPPAACGPCSSALVRRQLF